jgi:hypothetical protein
MLLDEEVVGFKLGDHIGLNFGQNPDDFFQIDSIVLKVTVALFALSQPLYHHYVVDFEFLIVKLNAFDEFQPSHDD